MTAGDPKVIADTIREGCLQLVRLRGMTYRQALEAHTTQCQENLHDSLGTTEEGYWRFRLETCDRLLDDETGPRPLGIVK